MNKMKEYAQLQKVQLKEKISQLKEQPSLLIIQVGDNEASNRYIRNKEKDCEEVGIETLRYIFPNEESTTTEDIVNFIKKHQFSYSGVIVQQPLPAHINQETINLAIDRTKDVDGFHPMSKFNPATAKGIVDYLKWREFLFSKSDITIIGRSNIVGKPLAKMLTNMNSTVTLCHSYTGYDSLLKHINNADLVICAVGRPHFLNADNIKAPVIDVGINFVNGKLCGDCYGSETTNVSPVPGGVGLLTRVALLQNVYEAHIMNYGY